MLRRVFETVGLRSKVLQPFCWQLSFFQLRTRMSDNFFHVTQQNGLTASDDELRDTCFHYFDKDDDTSLNMKEFGNLCGELLADEHGKAYSLQIRKQADMFYIFDKNKDGKIDEAEFKFMWNRWIKPVLRPISAILVVDVQNDFISGSLAIHRCPAGHHGEEVVPVINSMLDSVNFDLVVYSFDWHTENHISFIENVHMRKIHSCSKVQADEVKPYDVVIFEGPPKIEQKLWPRHCIHNTWGSELHPDLRVVDDAIVIYKGSNPEIDSYSAFFDNQKRSETSLNQELKRNNITDVFVSGVAYDVCVTSTAQDALDLGYRTILVDDACRGVDKDEIDRRKRSAVQQNAVIVNSDAVKAMTEGRDRRPELAYRTAMRLASV